MYGLHAPGGPPLLPTTLDGARVRASLDQVALALRSLTADLALVRQAEAAAPDNFAAVLSAIEKLKQHSDAAGPLPRLSPAVMRLTASYARPSRGPGHPRRAHKAA